MGGPKDGDGTSSGSDISSGSSSSSVNLGTASNTIRSVVIDDSNDSSFSDLAFTPPPSPSLIRRQRRNAIFQAVSPPHITDDEVVETYHNEIEVASVSDLDENPIENAYSTSGGEEFDMIPPTSGVNNANGSSFRTTLVVSVDGRETLVNSAGPSEIKFELDNLPRNEDNDADIDAVRTQSQLSDAESVTLQDPQTTEPEAKRRRINWACVVCGTAVLPNFHYCMRCFRLRRSWLPPRPRSLRLKKRKAAAMKATASTMLSRNRRNPRPILSALERNRRGVRSASTSANSTATAQGIASTSQGVSVDLNEGFIEPEEVNPVDSQRCLTPISETTEVPSSKLSEEANDSYLDRQCCSLPVDGTSFIEPGNRQAMSQPVVPPNTETVKFSVDPQAQQPSCSFCCIRPINSAFVHNKIAHQASCYTCADKILKRSGKCPMCRERVFRVVKLIMA